MRQLILLVMMSIAISGCVTNLRQNHETKLQELDAQYKSGQLDAVQYQAKYSAEVQDYNAGKMSSRGLIHHMRYN